jgi:hypothetical protein
MKIEKTFFCDWCEVGMRSVAESDQDEPASPLESFYIPDEPSEYLCEDCKEKVKLHLRNLREKLRSTRKTAIVGFTNGKPRNARVFRG